MARPGARWPITGKREVDEREARYRFASGRVARLATVRSDGSPHLVPIVFALDGETVVFAVDDKPKTTRELQRLANIRADPRVSVLVDHYDEDWAAVWWVRVDGPARVVDAGPALDRAVARLAEKYPQYAADHPPGPAVLIAVETWRWWSYS
jgi:PPOX class probable F420-dependent enzyme